MPLVKDINVNVHDGGTTALVTFTQLFEGVWQLASLDFLRLTGSRKWKHVHNPDVLSSVVTAVRREMNTNHSAPIPVTQRRNIAAPYRQELPRVTPMPDPLADVRLHDLPLSSYRAIVKSATQRPPVTPVTPQQQSSLPDACDCLPGTHTNQYVRGSGRWRSHALSFGCVGA